MQTRLGQRRCAIIGRLAELILIIFLAATGTKAAPVAAEDYNSFWLWAGVEPQATLKEAKEIYLLAGEVSGGERLRVNSQRSATPHVVGPKLWVVYRAQTVEWDDNVLGEVLLHVEAWRAAGNDIAGLQIDFDAGTRHLERYAGFLSSIRARLPRQYRLGVTGLLDWSAHSDSSGLEALAGVVDEVVLQIYQGRHVIPGYAAYLARIGHFNVPFKIGLLQGGDWNAPPGLEKNRLFMGYVVFLLNPKAKGSFR